MLTGTVRLVIISVKDDPIEEPLPDDALLGEAQPEGATPDDALLEEGALDAESLPVPSPSFDETPLPALPQ